MLGAHGEAGVGAVATEHDMTPQLFSVVTSPATTNYNCIAWAAGDQNRWWWPDGLSLYFWPAGIPRTETLGSFVQAFQLLGYQSCASAAYERGYERVAIFVNSAGVPTHMARQIDNTNWTSKLGSNVDVSHNLTALPLPLGYGTVAQVMRRPIV